MDKLLDLNEIIYDSKSRERGKLKLFEDILSKCHSQIKRYSREHKARECKFPVPFMVPGHPPYDAQVLINYLVYHVSDNGLYAKYIQSENKIYISWKDEDINIEKYQKRQFRIKRSKASSVFKLESQDKNKNKNKGGNKNKNKNPVSYNEFLKRF